jgi:hypothetical protein
LPVRFEVAKRDAVLSGVLFDIDENTGRAQAVRRILEEISDSD